MIIRQTTTIVFEYPQDYLQEQEWCKTKEDRWIHKGTDTLGAVYENTISYSIGQPNSSEKPNNSTISKMEQVDKDINVRSKDEPQTDIHDLTDCDFCKHRNCKDCEGGKDEPQTEEWYTFQDEQEYNARYGKE